MMTQEQQQQEQEKRKNKILFLASGFASIDIKDIDNFFNTRFDLWLLRNSDEKEVFNQYESDKHDNTKHLKYLNINKGNGTIEGVKYSGQRKGIKLTERKYIELELQKIDKIDKGFLDLESQLTLETYKDYLEKKKLGIPFGDYPSPFMSALAFEIFKEFIKEFKEHSKEKPFAYFSYVYRLMEDKTLIDNDSKKHKEFINHIKANDIDYHNTYMKGKKKVTETSLRLEIKEKIFAKYDYK